AFSHRLEILLGDEHLCDLRVHLCRSTTQPPLDVVQVEWLLMQNPRGAFTAQRPRLPGQVLPGTGLGRAVHGLLVIMAGRLQRDALVVVPAHHHLAEGYVDAGYRAVDAAA